MDKIRMIVELPASAGIYTGLSHDDRRDQIVDALVDALDTPDVQILDTSEEGDGSWYRSEHF